MILKIIQFQLSLTKVYDEGVETMRILAVGAHLDDIELACGGTVAKAVKAGHEVKMIVMSKSGYTNFDGRVMRLDEIAVEEGTRAARILGVDDFEVLDFDNKDIPYDSTVIEELDKRMTVFRPDIIFTHWPFDTHQAHVGTSKSVISAARRYNTVYFFEPISPSGRSYVGYRPQVYVDISDEISVKIDALKQHESELNKFGEGWIRGVKARAAFRGYEMNREYGEVFETLRAELFL